MNSASNLRKTPVLISTYQSGGAKGLTKLDFTQIKTPEISAGVFLTSDFQRNQARIRKTLACLLGTRSIHKPHRTRNQLKESKLSSWSCTHQPQLTNQKQKARQARSTNTKNLNRNQNLDLEITRKTFVFQNHLQFDGCKRTR